MKTFCQAFIGFMLLLSLCSFIYATLSAPRKGWDRFKLGDKVRRKVTKRGHGWPHGRKVFTVYDVGPAYNDWMILERDGLKVNVYGTKSFQRAHWWQL